MRLIILDKELEPVKASLKENQLNEEGFLPIIDVGMDIGGKITFDADKTIFLMHDHRKTKDLIKAFSQSFSNIGIVMFDAHADSLDENDLLPYLIKNSIIKKESIVLVGVRSWNKDEYHFLKENKIRFFDMKRLMDYGIGEIAETIMETSRKFDALYLSIDLDVLDPAFVKVDNPEPAGLTTRELLFFIQRLKKLRNLRAIDIAELNPKDINNANSDVVLKIVREII